MVVSLDGGRVRVRRKKRGPKTKKGRNRFHTDWKEPKLLILYVVGDDGRPSQTWAPIIDGTLRGPEAVFALLLSYARQIGLNAADKVLFIADGAPWIWQRLQRLIAALGLSPTQVLGLIDFYHAAKQLSDAVKLRRWSATQRTRWLNRTRGLLKRARVDEVITALRELFIADGAPWIWQRLQRLIAALGLSPTQVLGLIDFYHAAKQLSDAVKLRRWSATQRTRWLNRTRGLLKRARFAWTR